MLVCQGLWQIAEKVCRRKKYYRQKKHLLFCVEAKHKNEKKKKPWWAAYKYNKLKPSESFPWCILLDFPIDKESQIGKYLKLTVSMWEQWFKQRHQILMNVLYRVQISSS